ncbi:MAG: cobalamin-independent methionine synthase II family protein [Xanthobacteraceae bacterium]|jgi:5-methyltetrahydropteroyltriglutamate--homocysteine methyltransferase
MKTSSERILTTHVGSLPRPDDAVALLLRKDRGEAYDQAEFDRVMRRAVADIVKRQVEIGLDVVSDGETSKIGYATYIKDRFNGFGGDFTPKPHLDLADHPEFRKRMTAFLGSQTFRRLTCIAPVSIKDRNAAKFDVENFRSALASSSATEGFLNAASPGVVSSFQPNRYYPSHEAYIEALVAVLQPEYEAIANAGLLLQIDCPDVAMSRHTGFQDLSEADFLKRAAFDIEALNHALANVPANQVRVHVCWGNYEGPHDHDIALEKILPIVLRAKAQAISFEAANPRHEHEWVVWRDAKLPDDKILIPGVLDSSSNYVEHPELVAQRIERFADAVGRERVIAGTDCGFGTFAAYSKVDPAIAFKKLRALAQGAAIASKRLWN